MAAKSITSLLCYDDHRSFTEDVRKRFSDLSRYEVLTFHAKQDMLDYCKRESDSRACKVAIIGVPDSKEQFSVIEDLTMEIKKSDPETGLILLVPPDRMEDIGKVIRFNIDAYIPRNVNMILRLHNAVKKLISEHGIGRFKRKRNLALWVLAGFILLAILLFIFAKLRFPDFF